MLRGPLVDLAPHTTVTVTPTAASTIMNSSVSKGWTPSMDLVEKDNIDLKNDDESRFSLAC